MLSRLGAIRVALIVFSAAFSFPVAASPQETVNLASVSGRVTDATGAVIAGATVTAKQTDTNITAETTTGTDGRFRFPYLKLGPYEIRARQSGFADGVRHLTLSVGAAFDVTIPLRVEQVDTSVEVSATATLETARTQIASTVDRSEIESLPMNGRNFLDLALLVPGVAPANNSPTQMFQETSAAPGVGLSISSQRNFSNNFIVDGLSANDDAAGFSGLPYSVGAVDQFQVVTSGGQAEFGRALGGYVSVVTRSGTNTLHGEGYGFFRDRRLNAVNALSKTRLPMSQQQFGGSVGGPVRRDRTFYFASVERRALDQSGLSTISDSTVATINARLSAVAYRGAPVTTGVFDNPVRSVNALGKIDHQISGRDQMTLRYSRYDVNAGNSRGAGGINAPSSSAGLDNTDQSIAFGNTLILSSRTVNETRAQISRGHLLAPPSDPQGPAVSISGVAAFGTLSGSPTARVNTLYEVVDNLSHQAGAHALRVGADVLYNSDRITYPRSNRGSYTFSSLANFLSGTYGNGGFAQTFGDPVVSQTNPNLGVYVQDEWKAAASLTVNAGLRYDLQWLETIHTDTNNVSPRVGLAWAPAGAQTVVRASAGLFFDRVPLRPLANALLSARNTTDITKLQQIGVSLSPTQTGAPAFPNILSAVVPTTTLVNLTTMDPNIQNASSTQAAVEVEHQFGRRTTASAGYQYLRGRHLIMSVNQNVPSCVASGNNNGCRPVSTYANNSQYSSVGSSNYHALQLSMLQRAGLWGQLRISYTLSKSMNNVGENFFNAPIDPFDLSKDWGRSDDDQRHRLVIFGSATRAGFELSSTIQYYSALPLNITSGVTTVQGTAGRPIANGAFIARNAGTGSDFFSWGARASKTFALGGRARLQAIVEGFNLTNRTNVLSRNGVFGAGAYPTAPSSTFNRVTAVGEPRAAQLALRVIF